MTLDTIFATTDSRIELDTIHTPTDTRIGLDTIHKPTDTKIELNQVERYHGLIYDNAPMAKPAEVALDANPEYGDWSPTQIRW
jgi:L-rhamnose isomerase